jgi:hypothetical protein
MNNNNNQFYVTLPSNAAHFAEMITGDPRVNNTASQLCVKLPQRLRMCGDWEVGMAEIIYPNTWMNLTTADEQNVITIKYLRDDERIKIVVPPGRYRTAEELVELIQREVLNASNAVEAKLKASDDYLNFPLPPPMSDGIKFMFDNVSKRIQIELTPSIVSRVVMSDHLMYMLGITLEQLNLVFGQNQFKTIKSLSKVPDIRAGFECLYVYCDICESQPVGDVLTPLLRIVNVQGNYGDIVDRIYDTPHYVPVLTKDVTSIEINIKNDLNQFIMFEYGKVVVKLHFRRCKPYALF